MTPTQNANLTVASITPVTGSAHSFAAALCGFVGSTAAATMVMFLLSSL